jgi:hypothetical protein
VSVEEIESDNAKFLEIVDAFQQGTMTQRMEGDGQLVADVKEE